MPGVSEGYNLDLYDTDPPGRTACHRSGPRLDSPDTLQSRLGTGAFVVRLDGLQDGMKLDFPRNLGLFNYLNQDLLGLRPTEL